MMTLLTTVLSNITGWLLSIPGILTVMIVSILISRLILTNIRNKKGADSDFYRTAKILTGAGFAIFIINYVAALVHRLLDFGKHLLGYATPAWQPSLSRDTTVAMIIVLAITGTCIALFCKGLKMRWLWIATLCLAFGVHNIYADPDLTALVGIIAVAVAAVMCLFSVAGKSIDAEKAANATDATSESQPQSATQAEQSKKPSIRKLIFMGVLWVGSIVLAYIAGERSFVSQAEDFVRDFKEYRAARSKTTRDAKPNDSSEANDLTVIQSEN